MGVIMLATRERRLLRRRLISLPIGLMMRPGARRRVGHAPTCSGGRSSGGPSPAAGSPSSSAGRGVIVVMELIGAAALAWCWMAFGWSDRRPTATCSCAPVTSTSRDLVASDPRADHRAPRAHRGQRHRPAAGSPRRAARRAGRAPGRAAGGVAAATTDRIDRVVSSPLQRAPARPRTTSGSAGRDRRALRSSSTTASTTACRWPTSRRSIWAQLAVRPRLHARRAASRSPPCSARVSRGARRPGGRGAHRDHRGGHPRVARSRPRWPGRSGSATRSPGGSSCSPPRSPASSSARAAPVAAVVQRDDALG